MNSLLKIILICLFGLSAYSQKNCYCFQQNGNKISLYTFPSNENKNDTFPDFSFRLSSKKNMLDANYYSFSEDTLIIIMSKKTNIEKLVNVSHTSKSDKLMYIEGTFREIISKDLPNGLLAKFKIKRKKIKHVLLKYDNMVFDFEKKHPAKHCKQCN